MGKARGCGAVSKRTPGLPQRPRGFWETPREAVAPLVPYLPKQAAYGEPCAGGFKLINGLSELWPGGRMVWASDIEPQVPGIEQQDAMEITADQAGHVGLWITNPPWPMGGKRGAPALPIIAHLCAIAPVWALLPWDFAANDYFGRIAKTCSDIVPIGRVSWMGNGQHGKDNAAWFRFCATNRHPPMVAARGVA